MDKETAELVQILRNSTRTPGSVFDRAAQRLLELSEDRAQLLALSATLEAHPDDYDGPCDCRLCRQYEAEDAAADAETVMA